MINKKEIILKILIFAGIIMILISIYIKYISPYLAELSKQKSDKIRIENLISINSNLNKLAAANPDISFGEPNRVYISLPSDKTNCEGLILPQLPKDWEYRCKPESDYKKVDGNGWIPVDFTKLESNPMKELPVDPLNKADNLNYYTFVANDIETIDIASSTEKILSTNAEAIANESQWVLTATFETNQYSEEKTTTDNGVDLTRFEIGSNIQLWKKVSDFGLMGYWQFEEYSGTTTADSSGNNNTGTLFGKPERTSGKIGRGLSLDGVDDYIKCDSNETLNFTGDITIEAWVKPSKNHAFPIVSKDTYHQDYELMYKNDMDALELNYRTPELYIPRSAPASNFLSIGPWSHIAVSIDCSAKAKIVSFYINGKPAGSQSVAECPNNYYHKPLFIGARNSSEPLFNGAIDEVRIYNRALLTPEIKAMYNATR